MEIKNGIKTPEELIEFIELAKKNNENYFDIIWAIYKYKWYNWYQNIHIKADSPNDIKNTEIFKELEEKYPKIHQDVENLIDSELECFQ